MKAPGAGSARVLAAVLTVSAAALATWQVSEGFAPIPEIPTKGDVPTIGHGSTRYEDGTRVRMSDPPITRERAAVLALNLMQQDCSQMADTLPGVKLHQEEYDVYCDFVGQYGIGNFKGSSIRRNLIGGDYAAACKSLLRYRFAAGYDCSTTINGHQNKRCWGVWTRQLERYNACMEAQ